MAEEQTMPSGAAGKPAVCVTGANGFIGSWVVKTLLDHGYTTIHLCIFPGSDASHLFAIPGAARPAVRLITHQVDLLDSAAVDTAVEGCGGGGIFHVASPCTLEDPVDPQKELLDPAVKGTLNVLAAAKKYDVLRVVLTSSISAIVPNPKWPEGKVFDEDSWTDLDYCKSRQKWYPVSKTLAEKAAWDFAKENDVDVVSINPATCLGQLLQPGLNASCAVLLQLLQGSKDTQEYHWLGAVHVKDVAKAQLLLFETPTASGRYLCTNGIYQFGDFADKVSKLFPEFPVHRFSGETQPGMVACEDAAKRLIGLGLEFTAVDEAVRDTVLSLKGKGLLLGQGKPSS
ncbi:phenylacetaldehyde reductase [Andrographis paniculata]|uniref:phenylacetaldehyde reductase n=1 Tax=Andrographis paniculata TaxID=175694 RepID=UPI0021E92FA2|nr:phenylacetaldehyde reductase [Andrographis paniculata]